MPSAAPACVGLIMDGNRRWAKERGLPTLEGHRAGLARVESIVRRAHERGVGTVVLYAFSTENWNRAPAEVSYLMALFERAFAEDFAALERDGCRLRFIGDLGRLPEKLRARAADAEARTAGGTAGTLAVALSYGGRAEIVAAANKLIAEGEGPATEDSFRAALWSADIPDPDLIIRTGKEKRLSNFLTFQSAYSELFFEDAYWPDFAPADFDRVLEEYAARERRRGR